MPSEEADEMLRILESQFAGHLPDRLVRVEQALFRRVDHLQLDILLRRFSGLLFDQIAEIVGRKAYLVGEIAHRRQSLPRGDALREVIVQQSFETGQRIEVQVFALIVAVSAPVMPLLFSGTDRRTGSVVFAYDLNPRYGEQLPSVRLTGLAPDLRYRIREINLMPGQNPRIEHNDRVVSGDYLMKAGLKLFSTDRARSVVVELKAE